MISLKKREINLIVLLITIKRALNPFTYPLSPCHGSVGVHVRVEMHKEKLFKNSKFSNISYYCSTISS